MRRHRVVRVPGSSANLGPGYDALAAALSVALELEVEETGGELVVECDTEGVPCDRTNLCVQAFERLHPADGLTFKISSQIPVSGGLGSSAAAIVAGLVAADHMFELDAPLFDHAAALEGHPDNVAAALYGGFVICTADGPPARFEPVPGLEGVIAIPPDPVPTSEARAALPAEVPIADAVYNTSHAALLVLGLARGDLDLVARGLADRLHQPRRAHLYPRSMELLAQAHELGAIGATISGAGPTVLFWCHWQQTGALYEALRAAAPDCEVARVQFVPGGADVRAL
jgi:homoserine kinase